MFYAQSTILERILRLKPWHRSKANGRLADQRAKAAAAYIPTLESGGFSSFPDK